MGRPLVFQRTDGRGAVVDSAYLLPDDPVPAYAPRPAAAVSVAPVSVAPVSVAPVPVPVPVPEVRPRRRIPWPWLGAAAVAGGASLGLYALGGRTERRLLGTDPGVDDATGLVQLQRQANGLYTAAGAAGVVAGVGVVAFGVDLAVLGPRERR
ncbi:MAG: hypothetical protein R3F59_15750 [Myxococcota bacterium]